MMEDDSLSHHLGGTFVVQNCFQMRKLIVIEIRGV